MRMCLVRLLILWDHTFVFIALVKILYCSYVDMPTFITALYLWHLTRFVCARQLKTVRKQFNEYESSKRTLICITLCLASFVVVVVFLSSDRFVLRRRVAVLCKFGLAVATPLLSIRRIETIYTGQCPPPGENVIHSSLCSLLTQPSVQYPPVVFQTNINPYPTPTLSSHKPCIDLTVNVTQPNHTAIVWALSFGRPRSNRPPSLMGPDFYTFHQEDGGGPWLPNGLYEGIWTASFAGPGTSEEPQSCSWKMRNIFLLLRIFYYLLLWQPDVRQPTVAPNVEQIYVWIVLLNLTSTFSDERFSSLFLGRHIFSWPFIQAVVLVAYDIRHW